MARGGRGSTRGCGCEGAASAAGRGHRQARARAAGAGLAPVAHARVKNQMKLQIIEPGKPQRGRAMRSLPEHFGATRPAVSVSRRHVCYPWRSSSIYHGHGTIPCPAAPPPRHPAIARTWPKRQQSGVAFLYAPVLGSLRVCAPNSATRPLVVPLRAHHHWADAGCELWCKEAREYPRNTRQSGVVRRLR